MSSDAKFALGLAAVVAAFVFMVVTITSNADSQTITYLPDGCLLAEEDRNGWTHEDTFTRIVYCPK